MSFAEAARELSLSPSAVSHSVRKLEDLLGHRLFQRSTREGAMLMEHIQRGMHEMQRGFALLASEERTPLRLHTAPSFATQWLLPRLAGFVRDHPNIDLRFSASTDYARFDDFDLDIVYGEPKSSPHEKIPLVREGLAPFCTPALAERIRKPEDLYHMPLIQCEVQMYQWKGWFERLVRGELVAAADDGLGVVLESTLLSERELQRGELVRPLAGSTREVEYVGHYLVHPRRAHRHEAFETFRTWLLNALGIGEPS